MLKNHIKLLIKAIAGKFGYEIKTPSKQTISLEVVTRKPKCLQKGRVLIAYILEPFLTKTHKVFSGHTHYNESTLIVDTFLDMGFEVDIIDYRNGNFVPQKKYDIFLSARIHFQAIARRLNRSCIKIAHLDTAHWLFNNHAAYARYLALQERRGAVISCKKIFEKSWAIEEADYATVLGNEFTIGTYEYSEKPLYPIPVPTACNYDWPTNKDFDRCRNTFLWMGSSGIVNKGLDIVLEAFAEMPDFHLIVCGPIENETLFREEYNSELYQLKNISTIGWIDVASKQFVDICQNCIALIYPSCSEGQAGAVITCMQAGLIPLVSYESGVDVNDFGVILQNCSVSCVKETAKSISALPKNILERMSKNAWMYARENHTAQAYQTKFREAISDIMSRHDIKTGHI